MPLATSSSSWLLICSRQQYGIVLAAVKAVGTASSVSSMSAVWHSDGKVRSSRNHNGDNTTDRAMFCSAPPVTHASHNHCTLLARTAPALELVSLHTARSRRPPPGPLGQGRSRSTRAADTTTPPLKMFATI